MENMKLEWNYATAPNISEVIEKLEKIKSKHGDLPCFIHYSDMSTGICTIEFRPENDEPLFYDEGQEPIDHVEIW